MVAAEETTMKPPTLAEYMREFSPAMAARVAGTMRPLFDPARDKLGEDLGALCESDGIAPLAAQALAIEGGLQVMARLKWLNIVGTMGVGKTLLALWKVRFYSERILKRPARVVLTCPNQLVKKWRDHAEALLPGAKVVIVKDYRDLWHLRKARPPTRMGRHEVYIIARDKGKLSYAWRPAMTIRNRPGDVLMEDAYGNRKVVKMMGEYLHCPTCGSKVRLERKGHWFDASTADLTTGGGKLKGRQRCKGFTVDRHGEQRYCGEHLWQAHNGRTHDIRMPAPGIAPRRVSPAEFIFRQRLRFDVYVPDEAHELKGESLQGQMLAWIARRSDRVITMTGTLAGGYAHDLVHILWRVCPRRMRDDGLDYSDGGVKDFIKRYGVLRVERKYVQDKPGQTLQDLIQGKTKVKSRIEKVLPGISPVLFSRFLLQSSVFIRLEDMHDALPGFAERVHPIPLTRAQAVCLSAMTEEYKRHMQQRKDDGKPNRAWSGARAAFLRWPDRPWPEQTVNDYDDNGVPVPAFRVPALTEERMYPKERRLIRLVRLNKARGRRCWIYTELTGPRWNVTDRYVQMFARHGISATVLHSESEGGPAPEDREEWIADQGADVILSNPNLVKTGLDLYDFPTLIFAYTGDSTYTMRQASRRAWRLGQKHDCEVHYLCYAGIDRWESTPTREAQGIILSAAGKHPHAAAVPAYQCVQSAAMSLMAKKMASSLALEGEFSASGLAAMAPSDDIQSQLARVIAGSLVVEDPRKALAEYRQRLEAMMPSITRKVGASGKFMHRPAVAKPSIPGRKPAKAEERIAGKVRKLERMLRESLGESLF